MTVPMAKDPPKPPEPHGAPQPETNKDIEPEEERRFREKMKRLKQKDPNVYPIF